MDSPHFAELLGNAESIKDRRDQIRKLAESVLQDSREFAYYLNADGVPVRDIAELLGVSPERVSQLLKRVAAAAP
jgi:DNA-directed RNA polymerase specialized sigma24 family protein